MWGWWRVNKEPLSPWPATSRNTWRRTRCPPRARGHERRGAPEYNQGLSERRVELAKQFLVKLGVPEANLEVKALGEEQNMTPEQVKQLVEQHPNLTEEQRNRILKSLQTITFAQNRRVDITLSSTGQQSVRQFPFNAEDALTLINPKARAKPVAKKKAE